MDRITSEGQPEGEYTDSEIPGEPETAEHGRHAGEELPGEYTDSEIPGETTEGQGRHADEQP